MHYFKIKSYSRILMICSSDVTVGTALANPEAPPVGEIQGEAPVSLQLSFQQPVTRYMTLGYVCLC